MAVAGWYPDPQDSASLRYYDGTDWTEHQQPATEAEPAQVEAASPQVGAAPAPAADVAPAPAPETQQFQAGGYAPPPADAEYGTQQFPAQPFAASQYPTSQYPASQYPASQYGNPDYATQQFAPVPPSASYPGQQPAGPGYPPAKSRRKPLLIGGIVVVLVVGLLAGAYFAFLRGSNSKFTYQGSAFQKPAVVLTNAETNLATIVTKRHGAKGSDTHCYFSVPTTPASGAKKTDIANNIFCGPVLFVDGNAGKPFLQFPLSASKSSGKTVLTAAATPVSNDPVAAPSNATLERADGSKAPSGAGTVSVPAPPAADKDALVSAGIGTQSVPAAAKTAVMGTDSGAVALTKLGTVSRYGTGDDARSAPSGEKLIAFQTGPFQVDGVAEDDLTSSAKISVDGGTGRAVPDRSGTGAYTVVAVPTSAKAVDLTLSSGGVAQSISLLTGKPAAGNIVVYARQNRSVVTPQTTTLTYAFAPAVSFADGSSGTSEAATVTFNDADLSYTNSAGGTSVTASSPANAILHISVTWSGTHDPGDFGFPPGLLTFTPTGGTAVAAVNTAGADSIYNTFDVPGNVTTGTLTIGGSVSLKYGNAAGTYTESVPTAVAIPITFAAN
jgi:hypothetical protein